MADAADPDPLLPTVSAVLATVDKASRSLPKDEADNFAFNVCLNALCSVLESVRAETPEQYDTYVTLAMTVLRE